MASLPARSTSHALPHRCRGLLPPVLLPPLARLVEAPRPLSRLAGAALLVGGVGTMVLIGQRMPLILTIFGLLLAGLLLPQLRRTVLIACAAAALLIGASAVVSPPTFHRLVVKFSTQMEGFWASDYGLLTARARAIVMAHPLTGRGFDGFRDACADPQYFHGWSWPADPGDRGGGLAGCNIHPHNFYLEAATSGGLPGLVLFAALVVAWLARLWPGYATSADPLRVGLFVSTLMHFWPIASTSSLTAIELGGFSFVLLGWGLAEAGGDQPR